jgi:hypothetical protein
LIGTGWHGEVNVNAGAVYNVPPNIESTNPSWVNVGTSLVGSKTTLRAGINFMLSPGSPAIACLAELYLPPQPVDVGAYSSALTSWSIIARLKS